MVNKTYIKFLLMVFFFSFLSAQDSLFIQEKPWRNFTDYPQHLDTTSELPIPHSYNSLHQVGYINMPSAKMAPEGEMGVSFSALAPYSLYNARFQIHSNIELSFNYRVFNHFQDAVIGKYGYGDFTQRSLNIKILLPYLNEAHHSLPKISIGFNDCVGMKLFKANYIVMTEIFPSLNLEASLGMGNGRINGIFGGLFWMPFRFLEIPYMQNIGLVLEYDPICYEPHPKASQKTSSLNFGLQYSLSNSLSCALNYIKGNTYTFSLSSNFNFGQTEGFLPKIHDPPLLPPRMITPIPEKNLQADTPSAIQTLITKQGFVPKEISTKKENGNETLIIKISNPRFRKETDLQSRLWSLAKQIPPNSFAKMIVIIEASGCPVCQYSFPINHLHNTYQNISQWNQLSPLSEKDATSSLLPDQCLFSTQEQLWQYKLLPIIEPHFGSVKGKYKFSYGMALFMNGTLPLFQVSYFSKTTFLFDSNIDTLKGIDWLNPSMLPNVRTDTPCYTAKRIPLVDKFYLQKTFNPFPAWYTKTAVGYLEPAYGGINNELLYSHPCENWGIGIETGFLKKRCYHSIGFTNQVRILEKKKPRYIPFSINQYFVNCYYFFDPLQLTLKAKIGQFLAQDKGIRFEIARTFPSGMHFSFWYTITDKIDIVNNKRYFDKGISFSIPFDIFSTYSSKKEFAFKVPFWTRDLGAYVSVGEDLFSSLHNF